MPPNKAKLHKGNGKSNNKFSHRVLPTSVNSEPSTSGSPAGVLSSEQEQQFELELCWCIQQLQNGLKSEKLNNKQIQDYTKSLNSLMSNTAPIIKKRQVMRLCFGDYRTKMMEEAKKASKKLSIKVVPATPSKSSVFIKKAIVTSSDNSFMFNFPVTEVSQNTEEPNVKVSDMIDVQLNDVEGNIKHQFLKSDNSFRFNFTPNDAYNEQ